MQEAQGISVCDVLVAGAFAPELAPFRPRLGDGLAATLGRTRVVAKAVGIGLVNAAVGTATRLPSLCPRAVVLVGTCGAYGGTPILRGTAVVARKVRLVDTASCEGRAAIPDPMTTSIDASAPIVQGLSAAAAGALVVDVATTLAVTTDDPLAARVAHASTTQVEHLEAFAVASACAAFGVPFAAVLGVANAVGSRGRDEWRTGHRAAADAAAAVVLRWLDGGAAGV
jgi:nucleoside phosphorylase